jgi:hypothetical protein
MPKKCLDIEVALDDLKGYIEKAAKTGKIDKELQFSLIERITALVEEMYKKIEALEDRLDLIEDKF